MDHRLLAILRQTSDGTYSPESAAQYREADDAAKDSDAHAGKCDIIRELSRRFDRPIDVLDLGCGTGRYFHCADNVRSLVGVDPSIHMLDQARRPVMGGNRNVRLVRSTLHEVTFVPHSFDLIVCVGVLAFWSAFDRFVLGRVRDMLRADGSFFATLVERPGGHPTLKRRVAATVRPLLFGPMRRYVEARLLDFTISEPRARRLAGDYFHQVTITKWQSTTGRVDLHAVMSRPK